MVVSGADVRVRGADAYAPPVTPSRTSFFPQTLIRDARLVPVGGVPAPDAPVDVRIRDGAVIEVAAGLRPTGGEQLVEAEGRWAVPGLWDAHLHMRQWALTYTRLDLSGTSSAEDVTHVVAEHVRSNPADRRTVVGFGHRTGTWPRQPTVAELDAVAEGRPVVLVSGDAHHGWVSSRALELLGIPPRDTVLEETDWFPVYERLGELPGTDIDEDAALCTAVERAAAKGIVGVVDFEFGGAYEDWPARIAHGVDRLRVRAATYAEGLDDVIARGWRSGDPLPGGAGLVRMGPFKIITDGSLNTRTAYCTEPYADTLHLEYPRGRLNYDPEQLRDLVHRAQQHGLEVAVHTIGDAALDLALDVVAGTGARGTIEHAQLSSREQIRRMAGLPLRASVQPAHLLDDRDVTAYCWPDRTDRAFMLRTMRDAGVPLALGSDAPVAPLDPWTAMSAAVHRSADGREPWNAAESLTAADALSASTDGQRTIGPGNRGDVVLLDHDPLAPQPDSAAVATHLRRVRVAATVVGGRVTAGSLAG